MMSETLVSLRNIHLVLDQPILKDITLDLVRGQIVTIIGPNGAGKSSLIKLIAGLYQPTSGEIGTLANIKFGYVPQKLFIDQSMPIKVSRFLSLTKVEKSLYKSALDHVNAAHLWSKQMHVLSGGEMQRVLLARAIAQSPDVLLLDEPLQGVDILGQTELYQLISELRNRLNCAIVLVSHDLHLVMAQTDQVICLNHHVCCQGKPESVSQHPEYLNLFGKQSLDNLAIYTHHHDHHHNLHGDVESCSNSCQHD